MFSFMDTQKLYFSNLFSTQIQRNVVTTPLWIIKVFPLNIKSKIKSKTEDQMDPKDNSCYFTLNLVEFL